MFAWLYEWLITMVTWVLSWLGIQLPSGAITSAEPTGILSDDSVSAPPLDPLPINSVTGPAQDL